MLMQPPVQYVRVAAPKPRGSRIESFFLSIAVLLVVAAVGVGAFFMSQSYAPSEREYNAYSDMAYTVGYRRGEMGGIAEGRNYANASLGRINRLKAKIARQKAFNAGYRQGKRTGLNNYRTRGSGARSYGYYGGAPSYRSAPTYSYDASAGAVSSAIDEAQNYANVTGTPVEVEVY